MNWILKAIGNFFVDLLARMFSDYRAREDQKDLGATEQRESDREKREELRTDAEKTRDEVVPGKTVVEEDDL